MKLRSNRKQTQRHNLPQIYSILDVYGKNLMRNICKHRLISGYTIWMKILSWLLENNYLCTVSKMKKVNTLDKHLKNFKKIYNSIKIGLILHKKRFSLYLLIKPNQQKKNLEYGVR